jgi:hypothetical protein
MVRLSIAVVFVLLAGSATSSGQGKATAEKEARILKGDDKGSAANNPQCKLFSAAEAGRYIGGTVTSTENAAMGSGCQWLVGGGNGDMIVAVVPATYHEQPKGAKGYKSLPDVGMKGFVAPELDGWVAGSIIGKDAIRVSLAGKAASEATTVALLKDTIKRRSAPPK